MTEMMLSLSPWLTLMTASSLFNLWAGVAAGGLVAPLEAHATLRGARWWVLFRSGSSESTASRTASKRDA
jgi:hypothetical protein